MKINNNQFLKDIEEEFNKIRTNLQIHLVDNEDINWKKKFLSAQVPKEVLLSSELLLDTVINSLMEEARANLKSASPELQNKFFDYSFREKIKNWSTEIENKLSLEPDMIKFSSDPRLIQGLIAGGITFITGAVITKSIFIPKMVIGSIVSGIVTIILSAGAFKISFLKGKPKAIAQMTTDIDNSLQTAKGHVKEWLNKVVESFENEFHLFCMENAWEA